MTIAIRPALPEDFVAYYGIEPPAVWTALCGVENGNIVGIGGVVYSEEGIAVGFLDSKARPQFALHRAALRFMAAMREVGEPVIITSCQDSIKRAAAWLTRLGFSKLPDKVDGQDVWRWTPDVKD